MSTACEIKLNPTELSDLNLFLLGEVIIKESQEMLHHLKDNPTDLLRPLLEKVRAARDAKSPFIIDEEEMDFLINRHLDQISRMGTKPQVQALHTTLFALHLAWQQAGGQPRPAFLEFQKSI